MKNAIVSRSTRSLRNAAINWCRKVGRQIVKNNPNLQEPAWSHATIDAARDINSTPFINLDRDDIRWLSEYEYYVRAPLPPAAIAIKNMAICYWLENSVKK